MRSTCEGLTIGSVAGSTPSPGRKGVIGGVSPLSAPNIVIPLGIGIGIAMPAIPVSAPIFIPAIPVSAPIFFIGGFCCAATGAAKAANASGAASTSDSFIY